MSGLGLKGRRILLVEDEYLIAEAIRATLDALGATVLGPVGTNEGALALLAEATPVDFALVDVNLRGAKAFAVADALLERGIPFVFMTGYGASAIPERFRDAVILEKPFMQDEIANVLLAL